MSGPYLLVPFDSFDRFGLNTTKIFRLKPYQEIFILSRSFLSTAFVIDASDQNIGTKSLNKFVQQQENMGA